MTIEFVGGPVDGARREVEPNVRRIELFPVDGDPTLYTTLSLTNPLTFSSQYARHVYEISDERADRFVYMGVLAGQQKG